MADYDGDATKKPQECIASGVVARDGVVIVFTQPDE
jgi:hypothetical protein